MVVYCTCHPVDFVKECIIGNGLNYKGKRSVTKNGVQCQHWNSKTPHEHK